MNRTVRLLTFTLLAFFSSWMAFAQSQTELLDELLQKNRTIQSIESPFVQKHTLSFMNEPLVSSGIFYYVHPDKLLWHQQEPSEYALILNGNTITRSDEDDTQSSNASGLRNSWIRKFLLGTIDGSLFNDDDFETQIQKQSEWIVVSLTPQSQKIRKRVESIEMKFDRQSALLYELKILEAGGDELKISFSAQKINEPINVNKFTP